MALNSKELETALINAVNEALMKDINKMRCKTHGAATKVKLRVQGKRWTIVGICCEEFKKDVLKRLG